MRTIKSRQKVMIGEVMIIELCGMKNLQEGLSLMLRSCEHEALVDIIFLMRQ